MSATGFPLSAQAQQIAYVRKYVNEQMPRLPYHGPAHAQDVAHTADFLGNLEGVKAPQRFLLETAGWLHDIVYKPHAKDNEERSVIEAMPLLSTLGYTDAQIAVVRRLILVTKPTARPSCKLERIIKDADMWNLGTAEFFERSEALRADLSVAADEKWYAGLSSMLDNHNYYTATAQKLLVPGLLENRTLARSMYERSQLVGTGMR